MLRNIFRTSRRLARQGINNFTPVAGQKVLFARATSRNRESVREYSSNPPSDHQPQASEVDPAVYDQVCSDTLESLSEYFEELVESSSVFKGADINYSDGVLTVFLGIPFGTYVINRQSPNKQIWLSSPVSGPKRYDLVLQQGLWYWVYRHDGVTLHKLLQEEISKFTSDKVDFSKCSHSVD